MVIDHIGALFFPEILVFRIIGRLSFPLFAFFIVEGFQHTRSVNKYLIRLGACAITFQIPDWFSSIYGKLTNNPLFGVHYVLNIFATLFLGLAAIALFHKLKSKSNAMAWAAAILMAVAQVTGADYGAYGVMYVLTFILPVQRKSLLMGTVVLHTAYAGFDMITGLIRTGNVLPHAIQLYSMASVF